MTLFASTSLAAYHSIDLPELEARVLEIIEAAGEDGVTVSEILAVTSLDYQTVSPRFAPLEKKGLIFRAGDTRMGDSKRQQKVMRHIKHATTTPITLPPKKRRGAFLAGMIYAAKIVVASSDIGVAKALLKNELIKAARK